MKIFRILIILSSITVFTFIVYRMMKVDENLSVNYYSPELRDIEEKLVISGTIQPSKEIEVKSTISGVLEELYVKVGEEVKQNQSIARVQYVKEPLEYKRIVNELEQAKTKVDNAEKNFHATQDLYNKKLIATLDYENEKKDYEILQKQYSALRTELSILQGQYKSAGISNIITATNSGTIIELPIKEGGSVMARGTLSEGSTIVKLADMRSLTFEGEVLESDIFKLAEGMNMVLEIPAVKDLNLVATLTTIAPKGFNIDGISRFHVSASINVPDSLRFRIKAGCSVNAAIILDKKQDVLAIDEKYFQFKYDSVYVEVYTHNGLTEKKFVKTGISDGVYTEIISGVEPQDRIKLPKGETN